jgi:hypothetical protein
LGFSDLWTGLINGIKLQIWATWLFYGVLVDLGDAVADEVPLPFDEILLEIIYRGLYHSTMALWLIKKVKQQILLNILLTL